MTDWSTDPSILLQQASVWQMDGDLERAEEAYRRILAVDPGNPDALNLLALIHHEHGDTETAIRMLERARSIRPASRYFTNLGVVLGAHGDAIGSISAYRQAIAQNPSNLTAWPGVLFGMDMHPHATPEVLLADRRAFNARHCAALTAAAPPHTNDPNPDRRLRVGYISADFRRHSASMVFEPVLAGHDHTAVEVTCYWQQEADADEVTERFQGYADRWRVVNDHGDEALAALIREDQIDILVDLSGYSNGHRIKALARKPAPIIMTGWGQVTGLGIDACDYILADAVTVPPEHERHHYEAILRLPCIVAYQPPPSYPEISASPYESNGYVTFGYLGRPAKTNQQVFAAWADILRQTPHSRLILKAADYRDASYRARITDYLVSLRISPHRFEFRTASDHGHHLATYAEIDIALDPFPHGGGVTTLEAALMGVPSVALLGDRLSGRIAPSILGTLGWRAGLVSESVSEYVVDAMVLVKRLARGSVANRSALRQALLDSILCQPAEYTRAVEEQYRLAWARWCGLQQLEVAS